MLESGRPGLDERIYAIAPVPCDFCTAQRPAWRYPRLDFAACDVCHPLIEAGDRKALAKRTYETAPVPPDLKANPGSRKAVMAVILALHDKFFERAGDLRRVLTFQPIPVRSPHTPSPRRGVGSTTAVDLGALRTRPRDATGSMPRGDFSVRLFHRTTAENAAAILPGGFKDATGSYMTDREWTGVWLSDRPLGIQDGARGDAVLEVTTDLSESDLADYEWIEEEKLYREWLIPRCAHQRQDERPARGRGRDRGR